MCPGAFPSPITRGSTPAKGPSNSPSPSLNFTTPKSMRKKPRFVTSPSEPGASTYSDQTATPMAFLPTNAGYNTNTRRVSDSSHRFAQNGHEIHTPRSQRRASSTSSFLSSPSSGFPQSAPSTSHTQDIRSVPALPSCRTVNIMLHKKLQMRPIPKDSEGIIYLIHNPERGIKIGATRRADEKNRTDEHDRKCGIEFSQIANFVVTHYVFQTEKLIQMDLVDLCNKWSCPGHKGGSREPTIHREWFHVEEEIALQTVRKWTDFMNQQQPYRLLRRLNPFWRYLLQRRRRESHDDQDHDTRRRYWILLLAPPTRFDRLCFIIDVLFRIGRASASLLLRVWPICRAFYMEIISLINSFVILIVFKNTYVAILGAIVLVCVGCSFWPHLRIQLPKTTRRRRARET